MFKDAIKIIVKHIFYILLLLLIGEGLYFLKFPVFSLFYKNPMPFLWYDTRIPLINEIKLL